MTRESLNTLFARYQRNPDLHAQLIDEATRYAYPIRRTFPRSDQVNGDMFDDAVQDVILRLTSEPQKIDPDHFAGLLGQSVRNALLDKTRRVKRRKDRVSLDALAEEEIFGSEDTRPHDTEELKSKLLKAVAKCSPEAIEAWCANREGMRQEDIARRDGVPLGTVKSRIDAIHKAMRNAPGLEASLTSYEPQELTGLHEIVGEMREMADSKRQLTGRGA